MPKNLNQREKLIIENELKFKIEKKKDFKNIFDYLNTYYDVIPYKNADMYDYYYDTPSFSLKQKGISYRVRYRPQISINIKLPQHKNGYIWSRFEYSCKIDSSSIPLNDLFKLDCKINKIIKENLKINLEEEFINTAIINSYRIGFNVRFKTPNILNDKELVGVAFFDHTKDIKSNNEFYEFEMESYEQTDVFASPYIFNEFEKIGKYISNLGHKDSDQSKYERCLSYTT